jgi:diguanylate cyclase (GGDEF)-like protein
VVAYLLAVNLAAVALVPLYLAVTPVQTVDLRYFAVLLVYCVVYGEVSRRIERTFHKDNRKPRTDVHSVWLIAGILLVHPALTAALVATFYLHRWARVVHRPAHQATFTVAALVCSTGAATGFLASIGRYHGFARLQGTVGGFAQITAVAGLFFLINTVLMFAVFALWGSSMRAAAMHWGDLGLEAATLALGVMLAWALVDWPMVAVLILLVTLVLHSRVLMNQLRRAASTDAKTGLLNTAAWYEAAGRELDRARRQRLAFGVLLVDLDYFKRINDGYGHLAGDEVLVAVAKSIVRQVREHDVVGRFGGEEFVVLLPGAETAEAAGVAERIRAGVAELALQVTGLHGAVPLSGLTASIGVAAFPRHGDGVEALLRATDEALFAAKSDGRNQVRLAPVATGSSRTLG